MKLHVKMVLREIINKGAITIDHIHSNTIEDVRIPGRHLSLEERGMIQALHRQGLSLRNIAAAVGCTHTTVFYELRRGTPERKSKHGRAPTVYGKARSEGIRKESQELQEDLQNRS